ncbi:MAG: ATP-dependent sacrificial sulfur transferase LarE [Anaerolineae bacterium]|nr:ATP-dependent sacrificial sulfur transferase LarE [Anaerolineae bacterium]MDW8070146.1 ATP-dependent sacrificial sulfur transferase LarE [Anaerolineae bacterium]
MEEISTAVPSKRERLQELLRAMARVAVAYSGGTDSTLLLKVACDVLGHEHVLALTAVSPSQPASEREEAGALARHIGVRHALIETHELDDARYVENTLERCYFCKRVILEALIRYASREGFNVVVDGANADDLHDHRPGSRAAREWGVRSPLQEAGLTKAEIREWARALGLPNWDKPAAACLASRVPYGTPITAELLRRIEQAEAAVRRLGVRQLRVRHHGNLARIEVEPPDFVTILERRAEVIQALRALGYAYVTLDLAGYRSGSMHDAYRLL